MSIEDVLKSVISHRRRAKEGSKLLKKGKPLSEMETPIEGPSSETLKRQRKKFISTLQDMERPDLEQLSVKLEESVEKASQNPEGGTSELEWQRNIVNTILEEE